MIMMMMVKHLHEVRGGRGGAEKEVRDEEGARGESSHLCLRMKEGRGRGGS